MQLNKGVWCVATVMHAGTSFEITPQNGAETIAEREMTMLPASMAHTTG